MTSVEKQWERAQKTFVPVRVIGPITRPSRVPISSRDRLLTSMHKESFNKGDGSFVGNWHDGFYNVSVVPRGTSDAYGKQIHDSLSGAYTQVQSKFWDEVAPEVSSA